MVGSSSLAPQERVPDKANGDSDSKKLTPCYLMVADILGFSRMITNLTDSEKSERISEWVDLVKTTQCLVGIKDAQLVSDTLFVREEDSEDGLARLLRFAQVLLQKGLQDSFPIRGAIAHGNVAWGELTYGTAVIQAHEIERSLDWIGVACSSRIPRIAKFWSWDLVVLYPQPEKSGPTHLIPAIAWDVPRSRELTAKAIDVRLYRLGDRIPKQVLSKIEHTVQFGIYLRSGKRLGLNPSRFGPLSAMEFLESLIESLFGASRRTG